MHRVATSERKPYPCFTEEDFPAVYSAAQSALKRAQQAAVADGTSMVPPTERALSASIPHRGGSGQARMHAARPFQVKFALGHGTIRMQLLPTVFFPLWIAAMMCIRV